MDYDLHRLGPDQFEQLAQALLRAELGSILTVFGDGPDGGREATWKGRAPSLSGSLDWDGYGVAQAKARRDQGAVGQNLKWLKRQIKDEVKTWRNSQARRENAPQYYLLITNVRLSAHPGGGIDAASDFIQREFRDASISLSGVKIWAYDDIRVLLDQHDGIRRTYGAFVVPGDILAHVLNNAERSKKDLKRALEFHAARLLREDNRLNLSQAGSSRESELGLADVFTDLPIEESWETRQSISFDDSAALTAVPTLISIADRTFAQSFSENKAHRVVLIGGPGQGKSTLSQYLAQVYRAEFLKGSPTARESKVATAVGAIQKTQERIGVTAPMARRWPVRVVLTRLADALSKSAGISLLDFIAEQVSAGSSYRASADDLRDWLAAYPWLLIVDGLDEVPQSSNRAQVLDVLSNFFVEVATLEGDVAAVVTTRPQGYRGDLEQSDYAHVRLADLDREHALHFAQRFIDMRNGTGTERSAEVLEKFQSASKESHTARLTTSPLQVTILIVLLERLGKAPSDRWRLFSTYYQVIYQREQEKSGPLADILSEFKSEIDHLHYKIGYLLQRRSAESGGTSSHLSKAEFEKIVESRLRKIGYTKQEAAEVRARIVIAATERMVFLAVIANEQVGFEIRSLQEFMAGEYVVSKPEERVAQIVEKIAGKTHWENVALFAMGHIFADRHRLRAEAVLVCDRLNMTCHAPVAYKPGSELALDVLLDGACKSKPKYEHSLGERAVELLDGVMSRRVREMADFAATSPILFKALERALSRRDVNNFSAHCNRIALLDRLVHLGCKPMAALEEEIAAAKKETLRALIGRSTVLEASRTLIAEHLKEMPANELAKLFATPTEVARSQVKLDWASEFQMRFRTHEMRLQEAVWSFDGGVHMYASSVTDYSRQSRWESLYGSMPTVGNWADVRAIIGFAARPSASTLAAALRVVASGEIGDWMRICTAMPWPLAHCVGAFRLRRSVLGWTSEQLKSHAYDIARMVESGECGDTDTWSLAEQEWRSVADPLTPEVLVPDASEVDLRDFTASTELDGLLGKRLPHVGLLVSVEHSEAGESIVASAELARRFAEASEAFDDPIARADLLTTALFLMHVVGRSLEYDAGAWRAPDSTYLREEADGYGPIVLVEEEERGNVVDTSVVVLCLRRILELARKSPVNLLAQVSSFGWINLVPRSELLDLVGVEMLSRAGVSPGRVGSWALHGDEITRVWSQNLGDPGLGLLVWRLDAARAVDYCKRTPGVRAADLQLNAPVAAARLTVASARGVERGEFDREIASLLGVCGPEFAGVVGLEGADPSPGRFRFVAEALGDNLSVSLTRRAVEICVRRWPDIAARMAADGERSRVHAYAWRRR